MIAYKILFESSFGSGTKNNLGQFTSTSNVSELVAIEYESIFFIA